MNEAVTAIFGRSHSMTPLSEGCPMGRSLVEQVAKHSIEFPRLSHDSALRSRTRRSSQHIFLAYSWRMGSFETQKSESNCIIGGRRNGLGIQRECLCGPCVMWQSLSKITKSLSIGLNREDREVKRNNLDRCPFNCDQLGPLTFDLFKLPATAELQVQLMQPIYV
jgi:hypothetical protein